MKRTHLFIGLIFLLISLSVSSQHGLQGNQSKIDSLRQLINVQAEDDEEKVRLLNEYARLCIYNLDFKEGLIATRDARELSKKLDFKGGEIMYYLTLSALRVDINMHSYYQNRAQWLSMDTDNLTQYYIEVDVPFAYSSNNDCELILENLRLALTYFENIGDHEIQANILNMMSGCLYALRYTNSNELINTLDKSIELFKGLEQLYPVFYCSNFKLYLLDKGGEEYEDQVKAILEELTASISKDKDPITIGLLTNAMGNAHSINGKYALAVEYYQKCIDVFEKHGNQKLLADSYLDLGVAYDNLEMYDRSTAIYYKHISLVESLYKGEAIIYAAYNKIAQPLYYIKRYDEARKYANLTLQDTTIYTHAFYKARKNSLEGSIHKDEKQYNKAIEFYQKAYEGYSSLNRRNNVPFMAMFITECYQEMGDLNKALEYALLCLQLEEKALARNRTKVRKKISLMTSQIYEGLGNQQKAYEYLKMYQEIRSRIDELDEVNRIADSEIRAIIDKNQEEINELEKEQLQKDQENRMQRLWILSIGGALLSVLILALILYRNNKQKQKANSLLSEQKEEIQTALEQLKSTQSQLIQSEKMASLGELTAGIAHEIQNPLNFVNNFSEVSTELVDEMNEEIEKGDFKETKAIAADIKQNLEKINHHGKRADAIVKGMLQHSQSAKAEKEPTDINALADEYLRLAYHGLRAKDKSFNATLKTDFDENIGKIDIIPQDIGRVVLNMITNAFYATNEKKKQGPEGYEPMVMVSTKNKGNTIEIKVEDNGNGVPEHIKEKVFQPFFTTKPTGKGTGLGLSLSYDIVKAHGGEISVESKEGEGLPDGKSGTEFIVKLPI